ncbi:MAG: tetratricopeptide repeat protein, partial [Candidatus Eremiobacterota bacterium]
MNFILYRLLFRRNADEAEKRLSGLIDSIRSAVPQLDPLRVQPLPAFEPPQQGLLICYPVHQPEVLKRVRSLLRRKRIRFEEHPLGPRSVAVEAATPEERTERKTRCLESGRFFVQLGHHEEALPLLQQAVELDPSCVESAQYLVSVLRQLDRGQEAEPVLRRALDRRPDTAAFNLLLGTYFLDAGRLDEAIDRFKAGIAQEPKAAVLFCQLGTALYRKGQLDQALTAFEEAMQKGGDEIPAVLMGMGEVLLELGRLEEAGGLFARCLERESDSREARLKLGWCCYHLSRLDEAEVHFLSVAHERTDPYWAAARFSLGRVYMERGSIELAVTVLEEVLDSEPEFAEAHRFLAESCSLLGDHEKAALHWEMVERLEPERSMSLQPSLAVCYSRMGQHEKAEACLYGCLDKLG